VGDYLRDKSEVRCGCSAPLTPNVMRSRPTLKPGVVVACLFACAMVTIWLYTPPTPSAPATLSLVSYTNDTWYAWLPANTTTAICVISNRTSYPFFAFHAGVQIKADEGWVDTDLRGSQEMSTGLAPRGVWVLRFVPPAGTNHWRCSATLLDDNFHVPRWEKWCLDLIRRSGIQIKQIEPSVHTIWSPELPR
jgi:hypothetical protein